MQIRLSRTTRNGRTYEYAQLVESYRRESDGVPTHRVIASLGALSPLELDNLRTTLKATRDRKRVVVARAPSTTQECRLNHFAARDGGTAAYTLNEVTAEQAAILRLLGYQKLGDEEQIVDRIVPR